MDFKQLQMEQYKWACDNFGTVPAFQPLLGIIEETGELYESKSAQDEKDAIGDIFIFLLHFGSIHKIDIDNLLRTNTFENVFEHHTHKLILDLYVQLSRISHAQLKLYQGIRTKENHNGAIYDGVIEICKILQWYCYSKGFSFFNIIEKTWKEVSQRNWKKNKVTGK